MKSRITRFIIRKRICHAQHVIEKRKAVNHSIYAIALPGYKESRSPTVIVKAAVNLSTPTGVVRNIDELGRVVIPKELRKTMGLGTGTPIEIIGQGDGI